MGLCTQRACGCALTSDSLNVSGSGAAGDPWVIEGASPEKMTEAERAALAGADLFEGLQVHTTDAHRLWVRRNSVWVVLDEPAQSWTPNWFQNGALVTLTNVGRYRRHGTITDFTANAVFDDVGDDGNPIVMSGYSSIATAISGVVVTGSYVYNRIGIALYGGASSAGSLIDSGGITVGVNPSFAVAAGDTLTVDFRVWTGV